MPASIFESYDQGLRSGFPNSDAISSSRNKSNCAPRTDRTTRSGKKTDEGHHPLLTRAARGLRLWALPGKECLHLAHAVEPAKTDAAPSGFGSDLIHRRVDGEEARAQGRERFGGGTDGKESRRSRAADDVGDLGAAEAGVDRDAMAPSHAQAKYSASQASVLGSQRATRSPLPMPRSARPWATRRLSSRKMPRPITSSPQTIAAAAGRAAAPLEKEVAETLRQPWPVNGHRGTVPLKRKLVTGIAVCCARAASCHAAAAPPSVAKNFRRAM